jgi:hypothetical protein
MVVLSTKLEVGITRNPFHPNISITGVNPTIKHAACRAIVKKQIDTRNPFDPNTAIYE